MKVVFATSNPIKLAEAVALLPCSVIGADLALDEIQSLDVQTVVAHKLAQVVDRASEVPIIVEDTGLAVEHWNGYPGALVRWTIEALGLERFAISANRDVPHAVATATSCVGITYRGATSLWTSSATGRIVLPRGSLGGWTPVFEVDGYRETLAEMDEPTRLRVSMRTEPLRRAWKWLDPATAGSAEEVSNTHVSAAG